VGWLAAWWFGQFVPHGYCYLWDRALVALHVASDALIALAYFSIPLTIVYFVRKRRDLPFHWMFLCFGLFIVACGTTHLFEIWTLWHATYWLSGIVKAVTAFVSVLTAILMVSVVPRALALPSPGELARINRELVSRTDQLACANAELASANRAKDRFLATMSHELRTPLNAIMGFTGTLLMKLPGPLTLDQDKQLRTIQSSSRHLLSLINDLLDLAKIESGKVQVKIEPVPCQILLEEVANSLRPQAESKGLRLELSAPETGVVVLADRRALKQILINLTNNAIKFTEHGFVRLELMERRDHGACAEISVTDTGVGIAREDQARLFQAFARVETERTRSLEGAGLGLHLSQRLAALLEAKITLDSEPGRGSRFALVLAKK
jgi:signal transduction histidine kinase